MLRPFSPRLPWIDRLLNKVGVLPRLVSTVAAGRGPMPSRPSPIKFTQLIHEWLWRKHSTTGALVVCTAITLAIITSCIAAARFVPIGQATTEDLATLNTLAQVAGGAFGTLITVVVFAIGLVSQRPDGSAMYMPFVARKYHVFVVAAAAAAICLANAVGPLMGPHFGGVVVKYILLTNFVTMPLLVLATVWLMCSVIEAAGGADLVTTRPVFRSAMRRIAKHDRYEAATANEFLSILSESPLKFNFWAGNSALGKNKESRMCGVGVPRLIVDVDLRVLNQIVELCRPFVDQAEFNVRAAPTLNGDGGGVIYVALLPTSQVDSDAATGGDNSEGSESNEDKPPTLETVLGPKMLSTLSELADRLFLYGDRPDTDADLRQFFARTQMDLKNRARAGDAVLLKARLEDYQALLREWLSVVGPTTAHMQRRLFSLRETKFIGPLEIDLRDTLHAAVQSNDFDTYQVVVDGVSALIYNADSDGAVALFADLLRLLSSAFYLAMQNGDFRSPARELFDGRMASLLDARKSLQASYEDDEEVGEIIEDSTETGMRHAIIGSLLLMIRYAVDAGESHTAQMLIDRLTRQSDVHHQHVHISECAPTRDNGKSLTQYALIVIVGWCQHMARVNQAKHADARIVMEYALKLIPPRHSLIGIWELYHATAILRAPIDEQLRISHWELSDAERRVGFIYTSSVVSQWVTDGFWVAMLYSRDPQDYEIVEYFHKPPNRSLWNIERLEERLMALQDAPPTADTTEPMTVARRGVIQLVQQRQRVADALSLRAIAETPLSSDRQERLRDDIISWVPRHRKWSEILFPSPSAVRTATKVPQPVRVVTKVHRDYLLDINSWSDDYGRKISKNIVNHESQKLIYELEQSLPCAAIPFSLMNAREVVRTAVKALFDRGFNANLLILPPADRFAWALFRLPLRDLKIRKSRKWGNMYVGEWEGLTVVRSPYPNISSVIVADSRALFGKADRSPGQPTVEMTDISEEERKTFLAKVNEMGTDPLPEAGYLRVATLVSFPAEIGTNDIDAAYRLDASKGDACFAMALGESRYHRSSCSEIDGMEHLFFSLRKRLDGESSDRTPCGVCKPGLLALGSEGEC